jgi:RNA polymerase sigma-70 factor (ECF subfamily)
MRDYQVLNDNDLIAFLKHGDQYDYTEIFERYPRLLIAHAYRLLGDKDEANDIVQDVLLSLWQKKENLSVKVSLSAYLFTATRNRIFNHISHQKVVSRYTSSILEYMENGSALSDDRLLEKELATMMRIN